MGVGDAAWWRACKRKEVHVVGTGFPAPQRWGLRLPETMRRCAMNTTHMSSPLVEADAQQAVFGVPQRVQAVRACDGATCVLHVRRGALAMSTEDV
jgi:hypothetical protein